LFGGHDEEGFKNPDETVTLQADEDYAISIKKLKIGNTTKDLNNG